MVVGLTYAGTMILFVAANKLTTAANTIFLQSTAPLYVLLASPWLLGERAKKSDILYMLVLAAGLAMFFVGDRAPAPLAPNPTLGNVLAVLAGVCWGGTVLGLRWLSKPDASGRTPSNLTGVLAGNLFAFAFCMPLAFPLGDISGADVSALLYLGVIPNRDVLRLAQPWARENRRPGRFAAAHRRTRAQPHLGVLDAP